MASDLVARIRRALEEGEPDRGALPPGASAVLVPVLETAEGPLLLFTRRSEGLPRHPGEVSFPGGRVDPRDAGPREAALREMEEEVGTPPDEVEVLGHLTEYETYRGTLISVYVGTLETGAVPRHPASEEEVDEVLYVPLEGLLEPGTNEVSPRRGPVHDGPFIYDVRSYEGRALAGDDRARNVVHYWDLVADHTVWGITGEVIARLLGETLGWQAPSKAAVVEDVDGFMPRDHRHERRLLERE